MRLSHIRIVGLSPFLLVFIGAGCKKKAPPPVRNASEQEIWEQNIKVIYFDYDHYDVRDDQRAILQHNGDTLRSNSGWRVVVEGHCDERGSAQYNLGLGQKRADSIKEFLV